MRRGLLAALLAWAIDDLFGGVFFHLLLGASIAAVLGLISATLAIGYLRLSGRYCPSANTNSA